MSFYERWYPKYMTCIIKLIELVNTLGLHSWYNALYTDELFSYNWEYNTKK